MNDKAADRSIPAMTLSPERRLAKSLAEYTPEIVAQAKAVLDFNARLAAVPR